MPPKRVFTPENRRIAARARADADQRKFAKVKVHGFIFCFLPEKKKTAPKI
jgi:hypothetical protein